MALISRSVDDAIAVSDVASPTFYRAIADAILPSDTVTASKIESLIIANARCLTETRVRIDFSAPALSNDALMLPTSYNFAHLSPGSVEVVPQSVKLPAGQLNPSYVLVDVSEHTNLGDYTVAISSSLRGALGQIGNPIPFAYVGVGVRPQIELVLAISSTEVEVRFTEALTNESAVNDIANYIWDNGLLTISVLEVIGNVVRLKTTDQTEGALYTLTVIAGPVSLVFSDSIAMADSLVSDFEQSASVGDTLSVTDSLTAQQFFTIYFRSVFFATRAGSPDSPEIQTSTDDVNWVSHNYSPAPNIVPNNGGRNLANGTLIAVGTGGRVFRSVNDGASWTESIPFGASFACRSCWYGDGKWIIGGSESAAVCGIHYSTDDGLTWSTLVDMDGGTGTGPTTTAIPGQSDLFFDGVYAPGLNLHIGVGHHGAIWTSPDGINWTERVAASSYVGTFNGIDYNLDTGPLLVAVGDGGEIQTSPDGINWTHRTPDPGAPFIAISDVSYSWQLDQWVIVGRDTGPVPRLQTSADGITWTARTPVATSSIFASAWDDNNSLWVTGGNLGEIQTSPDGINWSAQTPADTGGNFVGNAFSAIIVMIGGGSAK